MRSPGTCCGKNAVPCGLTSRNTREEHGLQTRDVTTALAFETFVRDAEPRLRRALVDSAIRCAK